MGNKAKWEKYTQVEDIAVNLDKLFSQIGPIDPVTGCQFQTSGGTHKQGYMMINAHYADKIGDPSPGRGIMVTGHRVLARLKFKRPITSNELVYHTCGNMRCLNKDHIQIGGYLDMNKVFKDLQKPRRGKTKNPKIREAKEYVPAPQTNRKYKYSIEQMLYIRYHNNEDCKRELKLPIDRIHKLRNSMARGGYKWIDQYDMYKTDNWKNPEDITNR